MLTRVLCYIDNDYITRILIKLQTFACRLTHDVVPFVRIVYEKYIYWFANA